MIDCSYNAIVSKLNVSSSPGSNKLDLVGKIESMDVRSCWNSKVMKAFSKLDKSSTTSLLDVDGITRSLGLSK